MSSVDDSHRLSHAAVNQSARACHVTPGITGRSTSAPADILPPQRLLRHPKLASRTSAAGHNSNPKPNRLSFRDTAATRRRHYIGHVSRLPATRPEMLSLAWVPRAGKMRKGRPKKTFMFRASFLGIIIGPR